MGLKLVVDQIFTPPLSDATPLIEKVRSAKPDFLLLLTSAMPDCKLVLEKLDEFKLSHGKIAAGRQRRAVRLARTAEDDRSRAARRPAVQRRQLADRRARRTFIERFKKKTGEPFLTQDALCGYGDPAILAEAMESRGRGRQAQGRRRDPRDEPDHRPGRAMLPRSDQVRRQGPPRRRADDLRAMAEGRAGHRLPDRPRAGEAVLAIRLTGTAKPFDRMVPASGEREQAMTATTGPTYRWRVGEIEIIRVLEFEAALFEPSVIHPGSVQGDY